MLCETARSHFSLTSRQDRCAQLQELAFGPENDKQKHFVQNRTAAFAGADAGAPPASLLRTMLSC